MSIEARLPRWTQRTNPLVWRNLSAAARMENPDLARHWRILRFIALILGVSLGLGWFSEIHLSGFLAALVLAPAYVTIYGWLLAASLSLPVLIALYGRLLLQVSAGAGGLILRERAEDRLALLRTIPPSLRSILLSQTAACIWNNISGLDTLLWLAGALSLPLVVITHAALWFPELPPLPLRLVILAGVTAGIVRPWLELVMAGALGTLAGTFARYRLSAGVSAALLLASYFALVNLPRLLPLAPLPRLLVEVALPLGLPPLVTLGALALAERALAAE
ncbi:MAG: hypothetical protein JXN59_01050 [Anaerolineae bacterium]|nr:hypothetical protein [Anaerolineae bacterium]